MDYQRSYIAPGWFRTLPTEREISVLKKLASQNEKKVERFNRKLYELELNTQSKEQADKMLVYYVMKTNEYVEAVNESAERACAGKLPARETIQYILGITCSIDTCIRQIDGKIYLLNNSRQLSPILKEILDIFHAIPRTVAGSRVPLYSGIRPPPVRSVPEPPESIFLRLCRWFFFGWTRNTGSGISG
ncbi:hypothetical protein L873DRAFT_1756747 [Choiromyces venosus 120613-1]|uniref:Uncharacterized protein n=1 Tax=Choiromyces venosus 120613-1 TaxID=1336337 RepID=A0A3N4K6P8_9PEZI|nr:hypothetical protein L873DRAFT_1756747 [Choiromyces venosus 120613-1]